MGHYARILVDLHLTGELQYKIKVERKDFAFLVEIEYERLPEFYMNCKLIGHSVGNCRKSGRGTKDNVQQIQSDHNKVQLRRISVPKNKPVGDKSVVNQEQPDNLASTDQEQPDNLAPTDQE